MSPEKKSIEEASDKMLQSISLSRVVLPVLIGLSVVIYLLWRQFDINELQKIDWSGHTLIWGLIAISFLLLRHLFYSLRLKTLADGDFSMLKAIELIFIWEFSSAVTPTSIGGSATALFVLSQERLSAARTATIVLYTVVLDSAFFMLTLPLMYVLFGPEIIRPGMEAFKVSSTWGYLLVLSYLLMVSYGLFFYVGIFRSPEKIQQFLKWLGQRKFLRKYAKSMSQLGEDMVATSHHITEKPWSYHLTALATTIGAWSFKFLFIAAIIVAILPDTSLDWAHQGLLFGRLESMFLIMAFSPTPGGSGFAEVAFGGFLSDFVPKGIALVIAFIWRLLTYYFYLIAGVIVIPNWVSKILRRRQRKKAKES